MSNLEIIFIAGLAVSTIAVFFLGKILGYMEATDDYIKRILT